MTQELFTSIFEAIRDSWRHLMGASPTTLVFVAAGIGLLAYFLLRNK